MNSEVIIIGAGASALMLGAQLKKSALFIEGNSTFGAKIRVSGGGKCNVTNEVVSSENYQGDYDFIRAALENFTSTNTLEFLKLYDVIPKEKSLGQLFCNSSREVLGALGKANSHHKFIFDTKVVSVEKKDEHFVVKTDNGSYKCKIVVVASGGVSFANLGASDLGYKIAQNFGHNVEVTAPALVGLTLQKEQFWMKELSGIAFNVTISYKEHSYNENLLFSHKGISGPCVLNASLRWSKGSISVDFLPQLNLDVRGAIWNEKRQLTSVINLPKRFTKAYLLSMGVDDKPLKSYTMGEKEKIVLLKNYIMSPSGTFGFSRAEVTKGGVSSDEINPITFESKKQKGLYFIGEVLNITGELGGYNLQWAFSSGASCAKYLNG